MAKEIKSVSKIKQMEDMSSALSGRHGFYALQSQKDIWGCISIDGITCSGREQMLRLLNLKVTDWNGFKANFLNLILASLHKSGYLLDFTKGDLLYYKNKRCARLTKPNIVYEDPTEPK